MAFDNVLKQKPRQMLEREPWRPVPIQIADLGGIEGMIRMGDRRATTDIGRSSQLNLRGLHRKGEASSTPMLTRFHLEGNPFAIAAHSVEESLNVTTSLLQGNTPAGNSAPTTPTNKTNGNASPANNNAGALVTQAVLNGIAKYVPSFLVWLFSFMAQTRIQIHWKILGHDASYETSSSRYICRPLSGA